MPRKKWSVATAALAVVKGKKLTNKKRDKLSKEEKQRNSDYSCASSDGSLYTSSEKEPSSSNDTDSRSNSSSIGWRNTSRSGRDQSDGSETTDSSYGCGTYHRRESLSRSSSSYSEESSFSSYSSSGSSQLLPESSSATGFGVPSDAEFPPCHSPQSVDTISPTEEKPPSKQNFESHPDMDVRSKTTLKSLVKSMSSKTLGKRDIDTVEESEAQSRINNKTASNRSNTSLNPSMYDNEQASLMQRRRSSPVGRGRGRARGDLGRGCSAAHECKSEGVVAGGGSAQRPLVLASEKKTKKLEIAQDEFSGLLHKARSQKVPTNGLMDGGLDRDDAEDKFNALLETVRSQNPTNVNDHRKSSGKEAVVVHYRPDLNSECESVRSIKMSEAPENCDSGGELSYSLKTELLANANSNLRSSVTSLASEKSEDSNDDASRKSVSSSRFASMMANLKSSNDTNINVDSIPTDRSRRVDHAGSDDDHIFEAPKIVNERGQSMRSVSSTETSFLRAHSGDSMGEKKSDIDNDEEEGQRSRFRVRRTSFQDLICGGNGAELESHDGYDHVCATGSLREYPSDDDSKRSDASISTASSGDDHHDMSTVSNLARMRYPEDDDNSSDDDLEYYGEPAMTILTPITEMGSMESDAESTSHCSDVSGTDSDDDDIAPHTDLDKDLDIPLKKEKTASSNLFQVIKRVRANDPELKLVELDGGGLNDFDAAKLLYLLHNNSHVTHISLANNKLSDGSAVSLAQVLIGSETIESVCLRGNNIRNKGALALKKALKVNEKLSHLDLNGNDIDSHVMVGLEESSPVVVKFIRPEENLTDSLDIDVTEKSHILEDACLQGRATEESPHHDPCNCSQMSELVGKGSTESPSVCSGSEGEPGSQGSGAAVLHFQPDSMRLSRKKYSESSCSLVKAYDESCICFDEESRHAFHSAMSCVRESDSNGGADISLILAMSLSLISLDCGWLVEATARVGDGSPPRSYHSLGDRERLFPLSKAEREKPLIATSKDDPSRVSHARLKASRSLQKMTSSRWKDSMSKASSLRRSLLSLSQQNISEERSRCDNLSVDKRTYPSKYTEHTNLDSCNVDKRQQWVTSFKKLDPRWQIRKFFNDMSVFGTVLSDVTQSDHLSEGAAIFSVWRPTSADAIAKMMRGDGVGKGLEIKGKSAKRGVLSGYIPFLQIHHEEHKKQIRTIPKGDRTKIFFRSHNLRDKVGEYLGTVAKELTLRVAQAKFALARAKFGCDPDVILREELHYAAKMLSFELENPKVVQNDDYAPEMYCIEVSCRILWEGLVERKDISRNSGSAFDTGRASQPAFQDMNFAALRRRQPNEPLPVLYQISEEDPFDARMLVMAYEEEGKVVPVVSDFDCFLIGSRNFSYEDPMSTEQVELLNWCVSQIEWILDNHTGPESWTTRWLEVLKYAARNGFYPSMPRFGFGDPTSYSMIEASVHRSAKTCGAVRHGPECFNFFFPQELDDEFLIIFPGSQIWKYVNEKELLRILRDKIQEGFTFPLNPKWLLCDPGWISLFQDLLRSHHPSVKKSIDLWFPPESGLRERILDINLRYPDGFLRDDQVRVSPSLAQEEYERYLILQRARRKMRGFIYWRNLLLDVRQRATSCVNDNCLGTVEEFQFLFNGRNKRLSSNATDMEGETIEEIRKVDFFGKNSTKEPL